MFYLVFLQTCKFFLTHLLLWCIFFFFFLKFISVVEIMQQNKSLDVSLFTIILLDKMFTNKSFHSEFLFKNVFGKNKNLPLNSDKLKFVAIFVFLFENWSKKEAILFLFGYLEMNSSLLNTSNITNQNAWKVLYKREPGSYFVYLLLLGVQ